jgi:hypothetical protein
VLATRLRAAGRPVDIQMPEAPGADWNDVLIQQARKGAGR